MKANSSGTHLDRDWMIRGAMKDEGVSAAPFERPAPGSLATRLADTTGQWALRRHGEARQSSVGLPGNNAGGEDERTARVERIETWGGVSHQEPRRQQTTAGIPPPDILVWLLGPDPTLTEVNVQDSAVVPKS